MNNSFAVLEHLPWLKSPRVIQYFSNLKEAEAEAQRLNSKSFGSNFTVANVELIFESGLALDYEKIKATKQTIPPLRF
jgi:hypothetical protein